MLRPLALALALALVASAGCKRQPEQRPDREGRVDSEPAPAAATLRLPAPHELSAEPDAALHVAAPAAMLTAAAAHLPGVPTLAKLGELVLATQGPADWARSAGAQLDGERPWTGAHVAGEDILFFPLQRGAGAKLQAQMAGYPKQGDFGAVLLPRAALVLAEGELGPAKVAGPQRLALVDGDTLTIAGTLAGLATGRELPRAYGKRPVWFTMVEARGKALLGRYPYGRIAAVGEGAHSLDITAAARPGQKLPVFPDLAFGALSGALASKDIAAGVSTRWTGFREAVREATHQMQIAVDRAGFAGKMMLDPIADQATRVLKMWNGRVLLAAGPARHLRVAFGADDPSAAHRASLTLLRDIIDNLQLARMFVSNIPNASIKKTSEGPDIWLLTVSGVVNQLPPELRTLADDGRLRLAFHGDPHAGAVMVVVGPRADGELKTWVAEANAAAAGKDGMKDLLSATLAASPEALVPLLQAQGSLERSLAAILALEAARPPTRLVLRQNGESYEISVRGPEGAKPKR